MGNFYEKSRAMMIKSPDEYGKYKEIIDSLKWTDSAQSYFRYAPNIEEALSILEMSECIGKESDLEKYMGYIIEVIKYHTPDFKLADQNALQTQKWDEIIFGPNVPEATHQWYGHFVASLFKLQVREQFWSDHNNKTGRTLEFLSSPDSAIRYSVITLNYDMVLEGIADAISPRFITPNKLAFQKEAIIQTPDPFPALAKVHGSVGDGKIIPMTANKGLYQVEMPESWKLAYNLLKEANQIRIIGYSMPSTDSYIKYLLKAAIGQRRELNKIDVICREDKDRTVRNRYFDFLKTDNVRFKADFVENYLGKNYNNRVSHIIDQDGKKTLRFDALEKSHEEFFTQNL